MATSAATNALGAHDGGDVAARLWEGLRGRAAPVLPQSTPLEPGGRGRAPDYVSPCRAGAPPGRRAGIGSGVALHDRAERLHLAGARRGPSRAACERRQPRADLCARATDGDLTEGLSDALASLPERQRRAFVLREWLGLSSGEVASRLGMEHAETYALLTRARRSMATALTASMGRTAAALNVGWLVLKLRALFAGGVGQDCRDDGRRGRGRRRRRGRRRAEHRSAAQRRAASLRRPSSRRSRRAAILSGMPCAPRVHPERRGTRWNGGEPAGADEARRAGNGRPEPARDAATAQEPAPVSEPETPSGGGPTRVGSATPARTRRLDGATRARPRRCVRSSTASSRGSRRR